MKKICLLIFLNLFLYLNIFCTLVSQDIEMTLFDDKFIYLYNNSNNLYIKEYPYILLENETPDKYSWEIKNNKILMRFNEKQFIIFGFDETGRKFGYIIYEINENRFETFRNNFFEISFDYYPKKYLIRIIDDNNYIFSFFNERDFYLYELNLTSNIEGGKKNLNLENNYNLNTIECDSFDGNNIFCVYSIIKYENILNSYDIKCYYSFEEINNQNIGKNELPNDISGASLVKIELNGKKQFIICYVQINNDPSIYCESFIQEDNNVHKEKIYFIGQGYGKTITPSQFFENNPIIVKRYKYSIYILVYLKELNKEETVTLLFISSLDFRIAMPKDLGQESKIRQKKDFLINDYYFVTLKYTIDGSIDKIDVRAEVLTIQCDQKELFELTGKNELDISSYIIKDPKFNKPTDRKDTFVSFFLDKLTNLTVDNSRNMGELLNKIEIYFNHPTIKLTQNPNLRISENYYIKYIQIFVF